jgi:diacylglycerol kinase family enzyme
MSDNGPIVFKRLVLLHNPHSSNADRAEKIIAALKKIYPRKVCTLILAETDAKNITLLKNNLRLGDILLPCGGDGTISSVVQWLLHPDMPVALRRTPVLPVGTGRMNDVARMLNSRFYRSPRYALTHGRLLQVFPLACVCTPTSDKEKPMTKLIIYTLGFGYTGDCSVAWNDPEFRTTVQKRTLVTRPIEFLRTGTTILKDAPYFEITHQNKRKKILDITASVGHIFGGYWRLPARLSQREFYFVISDDKSFLGSMRTAAELMTNRFAGGESATNVSFMLHDPIKAHVGGETFTPPAPCQVEISIHKEPVTMIATSPKA